MRPSMPSASITSWPCSRLSRARRAIRHPHADHVRRPECACGEVRRHRRVDAARHADDHALEPAARHLVAEEVDEPVLDQPSVDVERRWPAGRVAADHAHALRRARRSGRARRGAPRRRHRRRRELRQRVHAVVREDVRRAGLHLRERVAQMRHHRLEIGDERHVGARAGDVGEVDPGDDERLFPERAAHAHVALRAGEQRAAGELLARLRSRRGSRARRYTPCSSAMSRVSRSHRETLAGPGTSSVFGHAPRAGGADGTMMSCAPSSAAIVPVSECQASSQTSIAARPHGVSNARMSRPRSTNRSSSNSPYVGQEHLAMHVAHERRRLAERDVDRAVVQLVAPHLVEAERRRRSAGRRRTRGADRPRAGPP